MMTSFPAYDVISDDVILLDSSNSSGDVILSDVIII